MATSTLRNIWSKPIEDFDFIVMTIEMVTENSVCVPLFNVSMMHGMFYSAIENVDPVFTRSLHNDKGVKQWSFSTLHVQKYFKTEKKGFYDVPKGMHVSWTFKTTDMDLARKLSRAVDYNFGELKLHTMRVIVENGRCDYPMGIQSITIRLHTPTVFYRHSEKKYYPLSEKNILEWMLFKCKELGFVENYNVEDLLSYIRIIRNDTKNQAMHIRLPDNEQLIRIEGIKGYVTLKINGDDVIKEQIWRLFHIGQFLGMGSNTNMGFGHYSISKVR